MRIVRERSVEMSEYLYQTNGVTFQKTLFFVATTVITSGLTLTESD